MTVENETQKKPGSSRQKKSVTTYMAVLFVIALLLLLLAYFMQERAYAHNACAQLAHVSRETLTMLHI